MAHILIVDDSAMARTAIKLMLHEKGIYNIDEAGNGSDAIQILKDHKMDLVFMDINMNGLSGIETSRLIMDYFKGIGKECPKIVAVSGNAYKDCYLSCKEAGMIGYYRKPVVAPLLQEILSAHLI